METISFEEVEDIFVNASYWNGAHSRYWFQYVWSLLERGGHTSYSNVFEYYVILIYALVLAKTYHEFGAAYGRDYGDEISLTDWFDNQIDGLTLGQLVGRCLNDGELAETSEEALTILTEHYEPIVYGYLKRYLSKTDLFAWMYATIGTFYQYDDSLGEDIEYELNSFGDYIKLVEDIRDDVLNNYDNEKAAAFEYVSQLMCGTR